MAHGVDPLVKIGGQQGGFNLLNEGGIPVHVESFPLSLHKSMWNTIWSSNGMPKINNFNWTVAHGKILTVENLKKKVILGPSWCALCNAKEDTINHLFIDCKYSKEVWDLVLQGIRNKVRQPQIYIEFFSQWRTKYQGKLVHKSNFIKIGRNCLSLYVDKYGW
jgi:hypothetical protein